MTHTISVDNATFVTLKRLADENGRTIVGQLRWLLSEENNNIGNKVEPNGGSGDGGDVSELQQMINRLAYFEEGSPEYEEAIEKIIELQKNA